jgi:hypothetical protein
VCVCSGCVGVGVGGCCPEFRYFFFLPDLREGRFGGGFVWNWE